MNSKHFELFYFTGVKVVLTDPAFAWYLSERVNCNDVFDGISSRGQITTSVR
jgi:hypothetical protein